jgi:AraC-like DNA-binding protein
MPNVVYYKSKDLQISIICGRGFSKKFPTHRHKSLSLGMVLKGSRMLTILKSKYIIAEGDVFMINSNESHSIGETLQHEHDYIVISLLPSLVSGYFGSFPVFENIIESPVLSQQLEKLFHTLIQKNVIKHIDLPLLLEEMCRFRKNDIETQMIDTRLEKLKDLLDNKITENFSLTTLSDKVAISKFHLSRLFKNYTGMAPHQYLLDNRLRFAREMLESGYQISDIAIAAGFYDTSHFIRHFLKYFGVSPFDFQKGINKFTIE